MLTKSCHTGHQKLIHRPFEECFLFWLSVSCCNVNIKDEMVSSRLAKQLKQLRTINQHSISKTVTAEIIIASKLKITLFFCQTRNYPPLSGFISQLPLLHFCLPHYSLPLFPTYPWCFKNKKNQWERKWCKMFLQCVPALLW